MSKQISCGDDAPLVAIHDATKRYRGRIVLRLDALELRRGDCMLLIGANGSGKSTLLRMLAGVTSLSTGRAVRSSAFDALDIGYVPQAGGLYPNLTVAENLRLATRLRGRREPDRLAQRWYVGGLGLDALLHIRFRDLSGGFQRLAALSCALVTDPDGLFIDEPLSGVDTAHARRVIEGLHGAMSHLEFLVLTSHSADEFPAANRVIGVNQSTPV